MKVDDAEALLRKMCEDINLGDPVVRRQDDIAFVRLALPDQAPWAEISTPGERWTSLYIDGGFMLDHIDEEASDGDIQQSLARLVRIASSYLLGNHRVERSRLFRAPVLVIETQSDGIVRVNQTIDRLLRGLFRGRRSRNAGRFTV